MEDLFQHIIPVNEGYDYLFSDLVYVPIYETSLLVTKRTIMPISLVEEKVLQLIDVGVYQIDEIAQILGLKRKLLDVTLADLYSKNLVMVSTNSCKMMTAGREALNNLNRTETICNQYEPSRVFGTGIKFLKTRYFEKCMS